LLAISKPEIVNAPGWRAKVSANLLKSTGEKGSLKWRLYGVIDHEAIAKMREKRVKSGEGKPGAGEEAVEEPVVSEEEIDT